MNYTITQTSATTATIPAFTSTPYCGVAPTLTVSNTPTSVISIISTNVLSVSTSNYANVGLKVFTITAKDPNNALAVNTNLLVNVNIFC